MNEQEASKKAQEMIDHRKQIFCPMRNHYCRIDCECYIMPEVYNNDFPMHDKNAYEVRHGFCTCYALKGASD